MAKESETLSPLARAEASIAKKKADLEKTQRRYDKLKREARAQAAKEIARRDQIVGRVIRENNIETYNSCLVRAGEEPDPASDETSEEAHTEETSVDKSADATGRERDAAQRVVENMRRNREQAGRA